MSEPIEAAGVFAKHKDKFLFIKRGKNRNNPNVWALPGGKVDKGEAPLQAIVRETAEETGVRIDADKTIEIGAPVVDFPDFTVRFHIFVTEFEVEPKINFPPEEIEDAQFLTLDEVLSRPVILGFETCVQIYKKYLK